MFILITVLSIILFSAGFLLIKSGLNKAALSLWLFLFCASAWSVSGHLHGSQSGVYVSAYYARISFIAASFMAFFMLLFSIFIIGKRSSWWAFSLHIFCLGLIAYQSLFTLNVIASVNFLNNAVTVTRGGAYPFVIVYIIGVSLFSVFSVWQASRSLKRLGGVRYLQLRSVWLGLFSGILTGSFTNVILPNVTGSALSSRFAFVGVLLWAIILTSAIIKHKLFDIRLVFARSLAYILIAASLFAIFLGFWLLITNSFFGVDLRLVELAPFFILSLVMVGLAPFLRSFFNRVTNSIFFRDSYDSEIVLDRFSEMIVSEIELAKVIDGTLGTIDSSIRPYFSSLIIFNKDHNHFQYSGSDKVLGGQFLEKVLAFDAGEQVVLVDDLEPAAKVRVAAYKEGAQVFLKIFTDEKNVGLLVLGEKKSGNAYSRQDIGLLAVIGNTLSLAIKSSSQYEQIRKFNQTLQHEVEGATADLKKTNEKLKKLDIAKDEFVGIASHQLRTPLTSAKGYLSMVLDGDAGKITKIQREYLEESYKSQQRMVYLIADLLNASRVKTGKLKIEKTKCYLPEIVQGEVQQISEIAASRGIKVSFYMPKRYPHVLLDATKIRQVIMNFIDNAVHYTPKGGQVKVMLRATRDEIIFTVKDSGIGVKESEKKHLFTKFYRASNAKGMRPDGTGIGLYLAKRVVVMQGGRIVFESKQDQGSTFGFAFPRNKIAIK